MHQNLTSLMLYSRQPHRDPASLLANLVCPHCKIVTTRHVFRAHDGHLLETNHCQMHGDVIPMRSVVWNP